LDPNWATANAFAGAVIWSSGRQVEGEKLMARAVALDSDDANALLAHGNRMAVAGLLKQGLPLLLKAYSVEPLHATAGGFAARTLWLTGNNDEAIVQAQTLASGSRATTLASIYASLGRFSEAADALTEAPDANSDVVMETIRLLRIAPGSTLPSRIPSTYPRAIDFLYLKAGAPEPVSRRILDNLESRLDAGLVGAEVAYIWHPAYSPMRKTERFKAFMRKAGYVDYWRAKVWPEFCRPTTADDFECE
jgi:tetratricopeptide (TPR) repeat protein